MESTLDQMLKLVKDCDKQDVIDEFLDTLHDYRFKKRMDYRQSIIKTYKHTLDYINEVYRQSGE